MAKPLDFCRGRCRSINLQLSDGRLYHIAGISRGFRRWLVRRENSDNGKIRGKLSIARKHPARGETLDRTQYRTDRENSAPDSRTGSSDCWLARRQRIR